MCLLYYFQLLKNFHDEKNLEENEPEELYSKYPSHSFLFTSIFSSWQEGDVRAPATYFEKEPHMILIFISHCKKTHMDKHCQNYD